MYRVELESLQVDQNPWLKPIAYLPNNPDSEKIEGKFVAGSARTPPIPDPTSTPKDQATEYY